MSWISTLLAGSIGWMFGGPLGALAGVAIAHVYGKSRSARYAGRAGGRRSFSDYHDRQSAYFVCMFTMLGKLSKVDGHVSKEEGDFLISFLDKNQLQGQTREFAIRLFNEGRDSKHSVEELARQFYEIAGNNKTLLSSFYDMLYALTLSDGVLHPNEKSSLESIRAIFMLDESHQRAAEARNGVSLEEQYKVLGVAANASDSEVKEAYRKKALEFHPDRIASKGLPEEFKTFAQKRFQDIQGAWEHIRAERGL